MKRLKTLFVGPWIGELGWEIFCWSGFIRKLAERYERVIIACRTGHDLLYRDFATDIVHYDPKHEQTDMWKNHGEPNQNEFHRYYTENIPRVTVVQNNSYQSRWWANENWRDRQDFVPFGDVVASGTKCDVLMIVRNTTKCNSAFRNWPIEHATEFAERMQRIGFTVGCVGKSDSALHIPNTEDYRDLPLDQLAIVMANARVIVGPQSGPIHFATLCLLPQACWQTKVEHATRTETNWNPFNVPVETMPSNDSFWKYRTMWLPPIGCIISMAIKAMQGDKK